MNNHNIIFKKFSAAMYWNIGLYSVYKICFLATSFFLYKKLSPFYFSEWAMGNALIFLALLWIDAGFRKSVPRFYPFFARDPRYHKKFIFGLLGTQIILLLTAMLPFLYVISHSISLQELYTLLIAIFLIEGLDAILRIIYHAQFKQKQFNSLQIITTLLGLIGNFFTISMISDQTTLIRHLFITKLITSSIVLIGSLMYLPQLYVKIFVSEERLESLSSTLYQFIIHTICMWGSTFIKSLTERNFLYPYVAHTFGTFEANSLKLSHESALFFQRIATKTVESADTALLSYIQSDKATTSKDFIAAYHLLFKTIIKLLCWLILAACIGVAVYYTTVTTEMLTIFLIVVTGYIGEILLSPYERILEVQQHYKFLWLAYIPYIAGTLSLALWIHRHPLSITITGLLTIIHCLRLISSILMWLFAKNKLQ